MNDTRRDLTKSERRLGKSFDQVWFVAVPLVGGVAALIAFFASHDVVYLVAGLLAIPAVIVMWLVLKAIHESE